MLVALIAVGIVATMLTVLAGATRYVSGVAGEDAAWGPDTPSAPFISDRTVGGIPEEVFSGTFQLPASTPELQITGAEPWFRNCDRLITGYGGMIGSYHDALTRFRFADTPDARAEAMDELREQVDGIRSQLVDVGVLDDTGSVEPFGVEPVDRLEPIRGQWLGYTYFAYMTAADDREATAALAAFVSAVNAVTAAIGDGGDHQRIVLSCAGRLMQR